MDTLEWGHLLSKFSITGGPIRPVGNKAIADYELYTGSFKLPASYHCYCKTFGAGVLTKPTNFEIAAPFGPSELFQFD